MHMFSGKILATYTVIALGIGALGGWVANDDLGGRPAYLMSAPVASATPGYLVPSGTPSPSLPVTEDDPGWDCRSQGNHVCQMRGELWLNVSHLPTSLYARCLLGLGATGLSPEVASIDTEQICKPLYVTQG